MDVVLGRWVHRFHDDGSWVWSTSLDADAPLHVGLVALHARYPAWGALHRSPQPSGRRTGLQDHVGPPGVVPPSQNRRGFLEHSSGKRPATSTDRAGRKKSGAGPPGNSAFPTLTTRYARRTRPHVPLLPIRGADANLQHVHIAPFAASALQRLIKFLPLNQVLASRRIPIPHTAHQDQFNRPLVGSDRPFIRLQLSLSCEHLHSQRGQVGKNRTLYLPQFRIIDVQVLITY